MAANSEDVSPFTIAVPDQVLQDLKKRLELTRFPQDLELSAAEEWNYGAPTKRIQDLVEYWKHSFDWRKIEADINSKLPQFTTLIDAEEPHGSLKVHFVHKRSPNPKAVPLLFSHGWPGNFLEVSKIIQPLTNPEDPKYPAFHVVAPSLPGYVFSEHSKAPGLGVRRTALMYDKLMKRLGYNHYIVQGGDWGALVAKTLAVFHPDSCRGTHSNMQLVPRPTFFKHPILVSKVVLGYLGLPGGYSKREMGFFKEMERVSDDELGYIKVQSTKPQTVSYGLTDSPAGLLAWIYEKLYKWTDGYTWTNDEVLTWIMLYWVSDAGPVGSIRYYKESGMKGDAQHIVSAWSKVPLGLSVFKNDLFKFPKEWSCMVQPVVYYKFHESGGHFAAHEHPELLVEDIRGFTEIVLQRDKKLLPS